MVTFPKLTWVARYTWCSPKQPCKMVWRRQRLNVLEKYLIRFNTCWPYIFADGKMDAGKVCFTDCPLTGAGKKICHIRSFFLWKAQPCLYITQVLFNHKWNILFDNWKSCMYLLPCSKCVSLIYIHRAHQFQYIIMLRSRVWNVLCPTVGASHRHGATAVDNAAMHGRESAGISFGIKAKWQPIERHQFTSCRHKFNMKTMVR